LITGEKGQNRESPGSTGRVDRSVVGSILLILIEFCHTVLCSYIIYYTVMPCILHYFALYCIVHAILFSSVLWCLLCEPYHTRAWHAILCCVIVYCNVQLLCHTCLSWAVALYIIKQYVQYCRAKHSNSSIVWLTQKAPQHRRIQNDTIQYRATPQCSMAPQYSISTAPQSTVWQNTILKVWNQPVNIDI
jgi:hypothetical protein